MVGSIVTGAMLLHGISFSSGSGDHNIMFRVGIALNSQCHTVVEVITVYITDSLYKLLLGNCYTSDI